jgi:hypothetical protein
MPERPIEGERTMNVTASYFVDAVDKVNAKDGPVDHRIETTEELTQCAAQGILPKSVLVNLIDIDHRQAYLDACAVIEKKYTEDCTATDDPCLESGCAVEGEICLQPLLRAGAEYHKASAAEWIKLFAKPGNRIDSWKN